MELREFIKTTLVDLIGAIREAASFAEQNGGAVNPGSLMWVEGSEVRQLMHDSATGRLCSEVEFDLAVTTSSKTDAHGSAGIFVSVLKLGGKKQSEAAQEHVSRIRFMVPVVFPGSGASCPPNSPEMGKG